MNDPKELDNIIIIIYINNFNDMFENIIFINKKIIAIVMENKMLALFFFYFFSVL